ncbi:MAG: xylulokinase [Armatimonadota bacterium]
MRNAYLGIDLGGTGAKAGVFDAAGRLLGAGQVGYTPKITPDGHELPIETIYSAAREATRTAVEMSGANICALAISSQGQTFVSLDEFDQPLHPAILWYDSRATEQAAALKAMVDATCRCECRPLVETICAAAKILWLREHYARTMAQARHYLLLPDYLTYRLTGQAVTDPSTAVSTGLYADDAPEYCPEALAAARITKEQLARIQPPGSPIATISLSAAREWGLPEDTLVVTGTNDQYAGALGTGNCRPGIVSETSGTCLALVTLTEKLPSPVPSGIIGGRFPIPRYQFALAYAKTAGVVLDWFTRQLYPGYTLQQLDTMAATVPIGSHGLTMLPHFDGMVSPSPNPAARGAFTNLSLAHNGIDLYRAILEALSFSLRENVELLQGHGFHLDGIRSIGGGAKSDFWLQMKADVTGLPVERPAVAESATLGAAILAAVGTGEFSSIEESSATLYQVERTFQPNSDAHAAYAEPYQKYRELCSRLYENTVPVKETLTCLP